MKISASKMRGVGACVAALAALSLVGASSASAQWTLATWNPGGGTVITQKGDLTVRLNGGSPVVCRIDSRGPASGSWFTPTSGAMDHPCASGGLLHFMWGQTAQKQGGAFRIAFGNISGGGPSPWGLYQPSLTTPQPFTNASGLTPSKITFSNTVIGSLLSGGILTVSGTLDVKTLAGATVTLN